MSSKVDKHMKTKRVSTRFKLELKKNTTKLYVLIKLSEHICIITIDWSANYFLKHNFKYVLNKIFVYRDSDHLTTMCSGGKRR